MKVRNKEHTVREAFDWIIRWYETKPSQTNNLGVVKYLKDNQVPSGTRRMYFFVQAWMAECDIDLTEANKEECIKRFIQWRSETSNL